MEGFGILKFPVDVYASGLSVFESSKLLLRGGNGVWTLHHDLAHSWLGIPWELHKHKLQNPTNTNSPGLHGPKIIKYLLLII